MRENVQGVHNCNMRAKMQTARCLRAAGGRAERRGADVALSAFPDAAFRAGGADGRNCVTAAENHTGPFDFCPEILISGAQNRCTGEENAVLSKMKLSVERYARKSFHCRLADSVWISLLGRAPTRWSDFRQIGPPCEQRRNARCHTASPPDAAPLPHVNRART